MNHLNIFNILLSSKIKQISQLITFREYNILNNKYLWRLLHIRDFNINNINQSYFELNILFHKNSEKNDLKKLISINKSNISNLHYVSNLQNEIELINLKKLLCSGNNFKTVPSEIGLLTNLEIIWLNNNELLNLPSEIGFLTHVKTILLQYNKLINLPSSISSLHNLRLLLLQNNPILLLSSEILLMDLPKIIIDTSFLTRKMT